MKRTEPLSDRAIVGHAAAEFGLTAGLLWIIVSALCLVVAPVSAGSVRFEIGIVIVCLLSGTVVGAMIASPAGTYSGAHVNPAITAGLWAAGRFPGRAVIPYWTAQLGGSVCGTWFARLVWGSRADSVHVGLIEPLDLVPAWQVFLTEACTMAFIVGVMLILVHFDKLRMLPWVVGAMIGIQAALFAFTTGGVANPARAFGPEVLSGQTRWMAIYLLAPVIGAIAAALPIRIHHLRAGSPAERQQ